jgi:glutamate carboxypeptidase
VTGRESHAGAAHQDGVSANLELAHKIIELEALTDYAVNSTVNVGVMSGGEKRNTVPGCADAYVDMRFVSAKEGEKLRRKVLAIANQKHVESKQHPDYPSTESWAILHRPAKPANPKVDEMIALAMGISAEIGRPIVGTRYSGGGTDGSIAQAAGLPTIDSIGLDGLGAHSSREQTSVASLIARTQLAAVMLARLLHQP